MVIKGDRIGAQAQSRLTRAIAIPRVVEYAETKIGLRERFR